MCPLTANVRWQIRRCKVEVLISIAWLFYVSVNVKINIDPKCLTLLSLVDVMCCDNPPPSEQFVMLSETSEPAENLTVLLVIITRS